MATAPAKWMVGNPTSTATFRSPAEEVDLPDPGAEEEVRLLLMAEILNHLASVDTQLLRLRIVVND